MRTIHVLQRKSVLPVVALVIALTFVLAACGTNTGSGSGTGSTGTTPSPTATSGNSNGTVTGCPSNAVVNSTPAPNVTVKLQDTNSTINAHTGDVIEVQLPFGHIWNGPTTSQGILQLQPPAGYPWKANNVCVWRFTAQGAGTTQLTFSGRPICQKGQFCPQYIMQVPFTINVK